MDLPGPAMISVGRDGVGNDLTSNSVQSVYEFIALAGGSKPPKLSDGVYTFAPKL